jgi:holo-[acyl-carrier protein] synthase
VGSDLQSLAELRARPRLVGNRAVFTAAERAHCEARPEPLQSFAGLLCAKEACCKALSDLPGRPRFSFLDLEFRHDAAGRPSLRAGAALAPWLAALGAAVDVSISHSGDYAFATAVVTVVDRRCP